jgi:hypothetical protein
MEKIKDYKNQVLVFLYRCLWKNRLAVRYLSRIRKIYEILSPAEDYEMMIKTMHVLIKNFLVTLVLFFFSLTLKGSSGYNYLFIFCMIFVFQEELLYRTVSREEKKLLVLFEHYLGDVRHFFHAGSMVEEAIYDSMEDVPDALLPHIMKIYDVLESEEKEEVEKYKEIAPNKFFLTFLALSQITMEYGDTIHDGRSVFLDNLNYLKKEVNIEILKREKMQYVFSGLVFVTILPVFFLKAVENWGMSNLPELEKYYHGGYGIVISILIFLFTILAYSIISQLRGNSDTIIQEEPYYIRKLCRIPWVQRKIKKYLFLHPEKAHSMETLLYQAAEKTTVQEFICKRFLIFLCGFLAAVFLSGQLVHVTKKNPVSYMGDYNGSSLTVTEDIENYREILGELCYEFKNADKDSLKENMIAKLSGTSLSEAVIEELSEEAVSRIIKYQSVHYHLFYLIFCIFIAWILSYLPMAIVICRRYFRKLNMEDEVMQLQSIILMLVYIKRMNVEILLEWMENFSDIFRDPLIECVDHFSYDEELALERLKERTPFLPFIRIVEDLESCDRLGVEAAFDEIAGQRDFFADKRKQDNEITLSNKGVIAKVTAYVPLVMLLGLYLIVPFVLESLSQLMGYMAEMT